MGMFDNFNPLSMAAPLTNMILGNANNQVSQSMANSQMNFQREMSGSAHQREVQDLQKAGLNPILSAQTSGSSTPSGAAAPVSAPQISMPDFMANNISLKNLELAEKRLQLDKGVAAAGITNTLSDTDLKRSTKLLQEQGLLGRELGTSNAKPVRDALINGIQGIRDRVQKPQIIQSPNKSGAMLMPGL